MTRRVTLAAPDQDAGQHFEIHDSRATDLGTIVTIRNVATGRLRIVSDRDLLDVPEAPRRTASYVTIVATVAWPDDKTIDDIEQAVVRTLDGLGAELVGCNWMPDQDTVADGVGCEYAELAILDLNPGR